MDYIKLLEITAGVLVGFGAGYFVRRYLVTKKVGSLDEVLEKKISDAETKAKEIILEAKEKATSLVIEAKNEEKERRKEIEALEARVLSREESLDKRENLILDQDEKNRLREEKIKIDESELEKKKLEVEKNLEKVANLSMSEARDEILKMEKEARAVDLAQIIQKIEKENREEIEKRTEEIITTTLQRYSRSHVSEITTTIFPLADDDLKGKIIGREGRNIRALERATGVEFIIDEAPDGVIISSFDPYRREIARVALEKLMKDGRIQPAKIEEKVDEAKFELEKRMQEIGDATAQDLSIYDLPKELIQLLGRLYFRTSFGQNVLTHSVEVAYLSEMIARELGLNADVAKRGGLLHDIGKAIDHEVEGTHVDLGIKILRKYNINEAVIEAMQSHHDDYPYARSEAYVVAAADILSAARPGARRGTIENYIKRLGDLEKIATSFPGVSNAYAISAGRELRIFVTPEKIDDFRALELAREIADKIQSELKYPGEIKVNVIREMRAVEYAR
jgi:ribonuclease Y